MPNPPDFKVPSIEEAAKRLKLPVQEWKGRCHEIAFAVRAFFDIDCRLCYGHWTGPVAEGSHFYARKDLPFQRHGWLEMPDGTIIDPTRWVFENVEPYIYHGAADHYDEGGDLLRESMDGERPIPGPDDDPRKVPLHLPPSERDARLFIVGIFGQRPEDLNLKQVGYLANLSRKRLGEHAYPIFKAIEDAGQGAFIPMGNRDKILGARREKKPAQGTLFAEEPKGPYEDKR